MQITGNMAMADVIHLNYSLLQVITRFDIRLGFGNKTVEEVCLDNGVNADFFLEIVNSFHDPGYFPDKQLQNFKIEFIVNYLKKTHENYLKVNIPEIGSLINMLINSCINEEQKDNIKLINKFFNDYKKELISHIEREENIVLPYVIEVEKAYLQKKSPGKLIQRISDYSIDDFANEHNNVEDKLYDLKNIIIKFLPPVYDIEICNNILVYLFRLEKDLNNHARIEDKVLIPKVQEMERKISNGFIQRK